MSIRMDNPEFHASVADVRRAGSLLAEARARARGQVATLLDGGWSGAAADAFGEAWAGWVRASSVVTAELDDLADVLARVHATHVSVDLEVGATVARVRGRLG